ncbi:T-complex 11 [Cordyceps fumosorosea ARSEF 2679]|uniref:T-complex 11 n=1 Tax=Cordyceps fumosorosea (strain ARSEF 2679) TaxID=1081104 RepID=A0A167SB41_CORFA|nr:T-complex 11 [Cordyceps fumosorosea ARSEF 2679]OAA59442.1 T-complex 11 [Cordyceps fumosorosea ARSEF 2679]
MVPEQGAGGPLERTRRNLSTSAPCPSSDGGDSVPEADVQMQQPDQEEEKSAAQSQPSQESPRRCDSAPRATSPTTALTPSQADSRTSTPQPESAKSHRRSSRSSVSSATSTYPIEPPVTRATLSELDVTKIIHNPKLRHDINFDPELHFRPNLDGEKGRKKQDRANQFWRSLKKELAMFVADRPAFYTKYGHGDDWTLPTLLKAVKDIIQTLVPQRDRHFLDEGLNVDLLMQQFHKGIADLEKLAQWLSQVLKSHCAPMRDDWVDAMYKQLSNGNKNGDIDELVNGMRSLLSVLEAMKLDVANHQIRCLRPVLIEDTIHFEQKFFFKKISSRKMDIASSKDWYKNANAACAASMASSTSNSGDSGVFFHALARLVLPSCPDKRLPNTFLFDEERILKLRSDMLDAINLEVCMKMYEDLERIGRYSATGLFEGMGLGGDSTRRPPTHSSEFNFNTPLETSRPASLNFSTSGSEAASSARSSLNLPTYVAPENNDVKNKTRDLYNSLVALLQSATPGLRQTARWKSISSSIALQIFRYTKAPISMLATFEEKLATNVCDMDSAIYKEVEKSFHIRLLAELTARVREYRPLSGVCLFSAATTARTQSRDHDQDAGVVEDIAVRLAHLGVLHWRVWAQMAYVDEEDYMVVDSEN